MEYIWNFLNRNTAIFYDFETTGLNQYHDDIIEYAFICDDREISSLIKTKKELSPKIQQITGINKDMLANAPNMKEEIQKIVDFINYSYGNKFLIAHNNDGFDKLFLNRIINSYGYTFSNKLKHIDTLLLAKKLLPNIPSYNLKSLLIYFKIKSKNLHRAIEDTKYLKLVYYKLCEVLSKEIKIEKEIIIANPNIVYNYLYN